MKIKIAWGLVLGLMLTAVFHGLLLLLVQLHIKIGTDALSSALLFCVMLLEWPAMKIGQLFQLPIEHGPTNFVLSDFNFLGYVLVFVLWAFVGLCLGLIYGVLSRPKAPAIQGNPNSPPALAAKKLREIKARKVPWNLVATILILMILLLWIVKVYVFDL